MNHEFTSSFLCRLYYGGETLISINYCSCLWRSPSLAEERYNKGSRIPHVYEFPFIMWGLTSPFLLPVLFQHFCIPISVSPGLAQILSLRPSSPVPLPPSISLTLATSRRHTKCSHHALLPIFSVSLVTSFNAQLWGCFHSIPTTDKLSFCLLSWQCTMTDSQLSFVSGRPPWSKPTDTYQGCIWEKDSPGPSSHMPMGSMLPWSYWLTTFRHVSKPVVLISNLFGS